MGDNLKPVSAKVDEKSRLVLGVGDADNTVLKNATIENSSIGHIGDKFVVKDGGTVLTADAIVAKEKLKKAKADDVKAGIGKAVKDALIPGHKFAGQISDAMDKVTGCQKTSRYDAAIAELSNRCSKSNDGPDFSK